MKYTIRPPWIMKDSGKVFSDSMSFIDLTKEKATGVRGDLTTFKIGYNFLSQKTFKSELFMAECIHKGILGFVLIV
jgi:hypothetical protein